MTDIQNYIDSLKEKSEERFKEFKIEPIDNLDNLEEILDRAYLEKSTWLGGDRKFVCLFIDLDNSSAQSFKRHPQTMARIYDYFTQNIVDVLNHPNIGADYIDIKGDGAFGIFEGDQASYKALYCAITFKTLFEQSISPKFSTEEEKLTCKFGIHKDKILIRRIGRRGKGNNNEVWAGRLVNNASKLANQTNNVPRIDFNFSLPILLSEKVYEDFQRNKQFGFYHCCGDMGQSIIHEKKEMFQQFECVPDEVLGNKCYYTKVIWCKNCGDKYMGLIK